MHIPNTRQLLFAAPCQRSPGLQLADDLNGSAPSSTTTCTLGTAAGAVSRALVIASLRGSSLAILHVRIEALGSCGARRASLSSLRPLLCGGRRLQAGRLLLLCICLGARILSLIRLLLLSFLLSLLLVLRRIHGVPRAGTVVIFLPTRACVLVNIPVFPSIHISV